MQNSKLIFLLDYANIEHMLNNYNFNITYSHDKYLISTALSFEKYYFDVYYSCTQYIDKNIIRSYKPRFLKKKIKFDQINLVIEEGDFIFTYLNNFPDLIDINAYKIGMVAAVHWIESPALHPQNYFLRQLDSLENFVDLTLTNNSRMRDVIIHLLNYSCDNDIKDVNNLVKSFRSPIIAERLFLKRDKKTKNSKKISNWIIDNLKEKKLIINSGGIWKWIDYYNFLKQFIDFCISNPDSNFNLIITGFANNSVMNMFEHYDQIKKIKSLISDNSDIVFTLDQNLLDNYTKKDISKYKIFVIENWNIGGDVLSDILPYASIGLSLNIDSIEGWQAFRQRNNNYIINDIPILSSGVGEDASLEESNLGILSINRFGGSYLDSLNFIDKNTDILSKLKKEANELHKYLDQYPSKEELLSILSTAIENRNKRNFIDINSSYKSPCHTLNNLSNYLN